MANARVHKGATFEFALVQVENIRIRMEGAAALILPRAGNSGDGERRVHVHGTVSLPRKAVAEPEEGALRRPDKPRKGLDLPCRKPGDPGCPFGRARCKMGL